ncbi:MAG TPA: RT0821/Lpp0805 family surface protein [Xanthobacteraceae bacterium]|nr:RT0821/Lpp0805 family surface protein [Xanthobacteraceae bacterium]
MLPRAGLHVAAVTLALTAGGCSFSYQLDSLFEKSKQASAETTGSIAAKPAAAPAKPQASDRDLAYARAAASEVLRRGGDGVSQPWENPETGARGTVTPIASAYNLDGFTCQDFLASYVRAGSGEDWMRGEACRVHKGNWEVRSLKPWKSS